MGEEVLQKLTSIVNVVYRRTMVGSSLPSTEIVGASPTTTGMYRWGTPNTIRELVRRQFTGGVEVFLRPHLQSARLSTSRARRRRDTITLVDLCVTPQSNYGYEGRRRLRLRIILPTCGFFVEDGACSWSVLGGGSNPQP